MLLECEDYARNWRTIISHSRYVTVQDQVLVNVDELDPRELLKVQNELCAIQEMMTESINPE